MPKDGLSWKSDLPRSLAGEIHLRGAPLEEWLNESVAIEPLLMRPLGLHGRARRSMIAKTMLRAVGFTSQIEDRVLSVPTLQLGWGLVDPLGDTLNSHEVSVAAHADWVTRAGCTPSHWASEAELRRTLAELGWEHEVDGVTDAAVLRIGRQAYLNGMTLRVARLLREWIDGGYLVERGAERPLRGRTGAKPDPDL